MKRIITGFIIVCMLVLNLTGCSMGGPSPKETAEAFMEALQTGDTAKVSELCDPGTLGYDFYPWSRTSDYIDEMFERIEISRSDFDETAVSALDEMESYTIANFVTSYELGEIEESDSDTAETEVKITFGYDYETVKDAINKAFNDRISAYGEEHPDVVEESKTAEGEEYKALYVMVLSDIMPDVCEKLKEELSGAEAHEADFVLSLTKGDEGWRVTGIKHSGDLGEIEETAKQFLDAFVAGDRDKAKEYSSEAAWRTAESAIDIIDGFKEEQLASFKSDDVFGNYEPSEEVLSALDKYVSAVMSKWISDYEIVEVTTDNDGAGKVQASKKGKYIYYSYKGIAGNMAAQVSRDAMEANSQYVSDAKEEMGEDAFYKAYFDENLPYLYQLLTEDLDKLNDSNYGSIYLTVENKDGKWLVDRIEVYDL